MATGELDGAVSLVTGAASGIGRATAVALAAAGSAVAAVDRDEAGLAALVDELRAGGAEAAATPCDLSELDRIPAVVADVLATHGRIDHLVNCAGITGRAGSILEVDLGAWNEVFAVNLAAPLLLMREVGRHLVERGEGGRIVNISSSSAFRAKMSQPAYGSSKAALVQLTRSAAAELGPHGINVNAVAPGLTRSAITAPMGEDTLSSLAEGDGPLGNLLRRVADPEDVAAVIVFLCSPASRQVTGQTLHTSAGAIV
jgi:NAD(P)-dependent dehydrogenase (short-subunit alcohol dehydrogenase family)